MRAWPAPDVPTVPVRGPQVRVHDSSTGELVELVPADGTARMYVCGITPYDATHMGHAATYVAFDLLNRAWRSAGHAVRYVQNVTDVDDPLLERAVETGQDWTELAERETELFRTDMEALRVLPPDEYVGAVESIPLVVDMIERLKESGAVYEVPTSTAEEGADLYFSVTADPSFGTVSGWSRDRMLEVFAERGGDPDRPGKKDPLDCLLWQAERPDDPAWATSLGRGRPGWHIECSAIAREHLGAGFEVQGGGSDLVFPHHEMSAAEAQVVDPAHRFARAYVHAGMVGLDGEKMSKSKGNLELVSRLREQGVDPMAIRLALLAHHYRSDWEWEPAGLEQAQTLLERLRAAVTREAGAPTAPVVEAVLTALATDLDAPGALITLNTWATATEAGDATEPGAGDVVRALADAALGLRL
jgi:L-cysteine:1D-myo-inositol 2-amino-2-deoxy-alpha-D-glucopyranoside ligase